MHGDVCARCGGHKGVFFTADLPSLKRSPRNLCAQCLDHTLLPRYDFFRRHGESCFVVINGNGPYTIPDHLRATKGVRVGAFFSGGAQHSAFGLEFWASPCLKSSDRDCLWVDGDGGYEPPNAWAIVRETCGYGGP